MRLVLRATRGFSSLPKWATLDPHALSASRPHTISNFLDGKVLPAAARTTAIPDPLNGGSFLFSPLPERSELDAFAASHRAARFEAKSAVMIWPIFFDFFYYLLLLPCLFR